MRLYKTFYIFTQGSLKNSENYYPFGMEMAGRGFSGSYRFGYQGSEKDNEVSGDGNSYTTEFRQLDPRLGRWFSVDPVFQPWQSPYTSMDNDPINLNDPMGDTPPGRTVKVDKGNGARQAYARAKKLNPSLTPQQFADYNKGYVKVDASGKVMLDKSGKVQNGTKMIHETTEFNVEDPNAAKNRTQNTSSSATFYSAGAGHDEDKTGYVDQTVKEFNDAGIKTVDINAHEGAKSDALFAIGQDRMTPYYKQKTVKSIYRNFSEGGPYTVVVPKELDSRISKTINAVNENLRKNPLKPGQQLNLIGYSTGSVIMAQTALYLAREENKVIDNLVLIGSPILTSSDLYKELQANSNIKNIIIIDIPGDSVKDGALGVPSFITEGDKHPHFKYAFHSNAKQNRVGLIKLLKTRGLK